MNADERRFVAGACVDAPFRGVTLGVHLRFVFLKIMLKKAVAGAQ